MKTTKNFLIVFLICLPSLASSASNTQQETSDPNETVIKYQEFLREEARLHREYVHGYYDTIWKLLGAIGIAVGGILTWLNWKSKEDIKKQVNEQFKRTIQKLLDDKLNKLDEKIFQIDGMINEGREKSKRQFDEIGQIILELSAKSKKVVSKQENAEEERKFDTDLTGRSILWVDDFPENNDYPRTILEHVGVKFRLATDTNEAIGILQKQKFDLIISDMGRGKNLSAGLDLLKEVKRLNVNTPTIIYASPRALNSYGTEALNLGATAITTGVTSVLNIIQKVLKNKNETINS